MLDALENILKAGKDSTSNGNNPVAHLIEEVGGLDKIDALQPLENTDISKKSFNMIEKYFTEET